MMNMDRFVRAYEQMVAEVEQVIAEYPEEMREDLRDHAQQVLRQRLQDLWEAERLRRSRLS